MRNWCNKSKTIRNMWESEHIRINLGKPAVSVHTVFRIGFILRRIITNVLKLKHLISHKCVIQFSFFWFATWLLYRVITSRDFVLSWNISLISKFTLLFSAILLDLEPGTMESVRSGHYNTASTQMYLLLSCEFENNRLGSFFPGVYHKNK